LHSRPGFGGIISIVVGIEGQTMNGIYKVHEYLFFHNAPLFKTRVQTTALVPDRHICISCQSGKLVRFYLTYIYTLTVDLTKLAHEAVEQWLPESDVENYQKLRKWYVTNQLMCVWVLADVLGDKACKNKIMDILIKETCAGRLEIGLEAIAIPSDEGSLCSARLGYG